MRKSKQSIAKSSKTKLNTVQTDKQLGFWKNEEVLQERGLLQKTVTITRFKYSSLGSELKKQTDIARNNIKDQTTCISLMEQQVKTIKNQHLKIIKNYI